VFSAQKALGQATVSVTGHVYAHSGEPLTQATVLFKDSLHGQPLAFSITRADGSFRLQVRTNRMGRFVLVMEHLQAQTLTASIDVADAQYRVMDTVFIMAPRVKSLGEVIIRADPPKLSIRGDTVEFRASAYRGPETRKVEDLIRNIQGFNVSRDGRVSFNGQEVDRILIEGEDLTEQHYQLLSRTLNAGLIDKVQVLKKFDVNRLRANMGESDKVGINLTINKKDLHKWSGDAEAGIGTSARRMADLNLVKITRNVKWIGFLQHNNIGLAANADMHFFFRDGATPGAARESEARPNLPLQAGTISPPVLLPAYTRNNDDFSAFAIGAWKASRSVRMKVLVAGTDEKLRYSGYSRQEVSPPTGDPWEVLYRDTAIQRYREGLLRISLTHDAGRRNLGDYRFDLNYGRVEDTYANLAAGAISDSMRERLVSRVPAWSFRGQETFALKAGRLLEITMAGGQRKPVQDFDVVTDRYSGWFGLPAQPGMYTQALPSGYSTAETDITYTHKRSKTRISAGGRFFFNQVSMTATTMLRLKGMPGDSLLETGRTRYAAARSTLFGRMQWMPHRKSTFTLASVICRGNQWYDSGYSNPGNAALIYRVLLGYSYTVGPLKRVSLEVQSSRDLPEPRYFHPSGLLSGQATILNAADRTAFPVSYAIQGSYVQSDLHKGSMFLAVLSAGWSDQVFNTAFIAAPAYLVLYPFLVNGNVHLAGQLRIERFFHPLRSKLSLQGNLLHAKQRMAFDGLATQNQVMQIRVEPMFTTAMKGFLNAEGSLVFTYSTNRSSPEKGTSTVFSQWQQQGYFKLKARISTTLYIAAQYNGYRLSRDSYVQGLDAVVRWSPKGVWSFTVTGHNLLQVRSVQQRSFGVNSQSLNGFALVGRYLFARVEVRL
jgi:hypothetical protein